MKALVIEAKYRFVLSGSLLGVELNDITLYPVGYLDVERMYPLDFEEYLWAKGVGDDVIEDLRKRFLLREAVDESLNKVLLGYFREYVLIGGMPEAISSYVNDKNLYKVDVVQKNIINSYLSDMTTYVEDKVEKLKIREVYKSIPSELNSKNKRFMSSHVMDKNYLKRKNLEDEFIWLAGAGVAIPAYNATEPQTP